MSSSSATRWLLGSRLQDLILGTLAVRYAVAKAVRPTRVRDQKDWEENAWSPSPSDKADFDIPTLLATKIAADYDSLVEIGCGQGWRIISIKQSLPAIRAVGLDIASWYPEIPEDKFGVSFRKYSALAIPQSAIVLSVGTMNCIPPEELAELFRFFSANRNDVLFYEPYFAERLSYSIQRRAFSGWYHPYSHIATSCGFEDHLPEGYKWRSIDSIGGMERWTFGFWRAPRF